jgi:hypothetical protein
MGNKNKKSSAPILRPKTMSEFQALNQRLNKQGFIAIDFLKQGGVKSISLGDGDKAEKGAREMQDSMNCGTWSNGPLGMVAWRFDSRDTDSVDKVYDVDGKTELGLGFVHWGPGNNIPSVIPPLAQSSPYTAAPLRYIADLTSGLGPALMYRFPDGSLSDFRTAEYKLVEMIEKAEEKERRKEQENQGQVRTGNTGSIGELTKLKNLIGDYVMTNLGLMTIQDAVRINERQKVKGLEPGEQKLEVEDIRPLSKRHNADYWLKRLTEWQRTWYGKDVKDAIGNDRHIIGIKEFLEENNLNLHLSQCMQDDVMLDIYFPTIGFDNKGTRGVWEPIINSVSFLPAHSTRLEKQNETRHINHCYFSDQWRTLGPGTAKTIAPEQTKVKMFPACMPQQLLRDMRYIVQSNQKTAAGRRPMWVVCPTFYPSLNKPYYPQPAWWSVFTSKAFDFSATILYDKYKARENSTSWGKIIYISLDYLNMIFADEGVEGDKDAQQKFIEDLDNNVEQFLQRRENNGKMMRQFMWTDQKGDEHYNVKIVDVAETKQDEIKAGKEELELSTSPIFLALQVDPRLVGVPMVAASNGGTALREMALLKQQQLNPKQRLYEGFLNAVLRFNGWDNDGCAEFHIKQQTFTTLDNSKTGTVETIAGEGA